MAASRFLGGCAWIAAAAALALAGCASVPQASSGRDAQAKRFETHPRSATLYVYRDDFPVGSLYMQDSVLYLDNRLIGATLSRTYFRIDLRPGPHLLHGFAFDQGRLRLETRPGELHFVSLTVADGTSYFAEVRPEIARREIARCCELLENWAPGQRPLLH